MRRVGVALGVVVAVVVMIGASVSARRAPDLTGKWDVAAKATMNEQTMDLKATMDLKEKDDELTGMFTPYGQDNAAQPAVPISEGKVDGENVTFTVKMDPVAIKFTLKLDSEHLKGDAAPVTPVEGMTMSLKIDATRSK